MTGTSFAGSIDVYTERLDLNIKYRANSGLERRTRETERSINEKKTLYAYQTFFAPLANLANFPRNHRYQKVIEAL